MRSPHRQRQLPNTTVTTLLDTFTQEHKSGDQFFPFPVKEQQERADLVQEKQRHYERTEHHLRNTDSQKLRQDRAYQATCLNMPNYQR